MSIIENPRAYYNAVGRNIIANAKKTWRANTERAEEIESAIEAGRRFSDYGDVIGYEDGFIGSMAASFDRFGKLTPNQSAAILKGIDARAAKRAEWAATRAAAAAASSHIGSIGERITITLTCDHVIEFDGAFGTTYINLMRDADGNRIVYKGTKCLTDKGSSVTVKATIKDHGERDGERQTIIARPTII
jgi:hypothetical protein